MSGLIQRFLFVPDYPQGFSFTQAIRQLPNGLASSWATTPCPDSSSLNLPLKKAPISSTRIEDTVIFPNGYSFTQAVKKLPAHLQQTWHETPSPGLSANDWNWANGIADDVFTHEIPKKPLSLISQGTSSLAGTATSIVKAPIKAINEVLSPGQLQSGHASPIVDKAKQSALTLSQRIGFAVAGVSSAIAATLAGRNKLVTGSAFRLANAHQPAISPEYKLGAGFVGLGVFASVFRLWQRRTAAKVEKQGAAYRDGVATLR